MYFLARFALIATAFGLLIAAACYVRPAWMVELRLDVWSLPELWQQMESQKERGEHLAVTHKVLQERMKRKEEMMVELIEGRLSLLRTAALQRDLSNHPIFKEYILHTWPSQSEAERLCRYTILSVEWILAEEPAKARTVIARLEGELNDLLRSGNPLTLPRTK